jgi:DivIVA domain-containing protein
MIKNQTQKAKRLTPLDIVNKDFKTSMRGYDKDEVNEFLDLVIQSYEEVLQENEYLKQQLQSGGSGKSGGVNLSEYDAVINEILTRIERLERYMKR